MKKKLLALLLSLVILISPVLTVVILTTPVNTTAFSPYNLPAEYEAMADEIGARFELSQAILKALAWRESCGNPDAGTSCIGLCQISPKWHKARLEAAIEETGIEGDLTDPYLNLWCAGSYLSDLREKYGDIAVVLMKYHGEKNAEAKAARGEISSYARYILSTAAGIESEEMSK